MSSLPDLKEIPKTAIFLLNKLPVMFFIEFTICCGIDSFNFQTDEIILEKAELLSKNKPSLLKHGPPANPGTGILLLE